MLEGGLHPSKIYARNGRILSASLLERSHPAARSCQFPRRAIRDMNNDAYL